MSLTKKTRFEVFKRDAFTCQYCGRAAPDVVLQVDHIHPKSKGGVDDLLNLITSCLDCNQGKRARPLSDDAAVAKRKKQLDELQLRREQLEMMLEWHRDLMAIDSDALTGAVDTWQSMAVGWTINECGTTKLQRWLKRFGLKEILEAMDAAAFQYLEWETLDDGRQRVTQASWEKAFSYIPRICACERLCKGKPWMKELYYARGILRNRLNYVDESRALMLMEAAVARDAELSEIVALCKTVRSWTSFVEAIEQCGSD